MRAAGISGLLPRKRRRTTVRLDGVRVAPDLLERDFRPDWPAPDLVGGHHPYLDLGGVPVPRARPGPVLQADRRLVDGRPSPRRARRRRARDGARPTSPRPRADPPLRPRLPARTQPVVATVCGQRNVRVAGDGLRWPGRGDVTGVTRLSSRRLARRAGQRGDSRVRAGRAPRPQAPLMSFGSWSAITLAA
jgi:hypothetical protein